MRDAFLSNLTQITNLDQLETEWPYMNWFKIIKRHITFEALQLHLDKFELPRSLLREALPVTSEIRLDTVCVPYLKSNLGHIWNLVIGSCARPVK